MNAKEYLTRINIAREEIEQRKDLIEKLRSAAVHVGGMNDDGVRVKTSNPDGDRMADAIAQIVDMENDLAGDIVRLSEMQVEATRMISALPDPVHARILYMRYVRGDRWGFIEKTVGISERHSPRVVRQAYESFESKYRDFLADLG